MNRIFAPALVALLLCAGVASAGSIGIGTFAGTSVPVLQEDQAQGPIYGLRAPVSLTPLLALEPFWSTTALGDADTDVASVTFTREGSDVTTFGANLLLTTSGPVRFFPYVGLGSAHFERTGQDETFTSWHFGLGLGFTPAPRLNLDLRAELQAAVEDGASRKMANIMVGASYALIGLN